MLLTPQTGSELVRANLSRLIDRLSHCVCMALLHLTGDRVLSRAKLVQIRSTLEELLNVLPKA